ncbi:MAG: signal peptidase I [Rickettsiales bacterium]|nr:signal peptidase I [Rickettsiales bacterium]
MKKKKSFKENFLTLLYAILAAVIIRSFLFEPFSIPSGSMYPTLKVGDYLFVSKFDYGFNRHSLPFSIPIIPVRLFYKSPKRGDVVVFKTPEDNKTDYIKRVIGLPGDKIRMQSSEIYINNIKLKRDFQGTEKYKSFEIDLYKETLPDGTNYEIYEMKDDILFFETNDFSELIIPEETFFVIGDNRDNSQDSRFIGPIPKKNLVGKGRVVLLSIDIEKTTWLTFWKWFGALRKDRIWFSLIPNEN